MICPEQYRARIGLHRPRPRRPGGRDKSCLPEVDISLGKQQGRKTYLSLLLATASLFLWMVDKLLSPGR